MLYGLEYAQLRISGQTIGQKLMGIQLQSDTGGKLKSKQIVKRMIHRDTASSFLYLKDREKYNVSGGAKFPHDVFANTVIKEV